MEAGIQRGDILLIKQNIDGQYYIHTGYADNEAIASLLSQDSIEIKNISLIHPAGRSRRELLNLTPKDIIRERMLIRVAGKGKKCRYSLLSEKPINELSTFFREYRLKNGF